MMEQGFGRFLRLQHNYSDPVDRRRATGILYVMEVGLIIWLVWMAIFAVPSFVEGTGVSEQVGIAVISPLVTVLIYWFVQTGRLTLASVVVVAGTLPPMIVLLGTDTLESASFVLVAMPIVAAGLLLNLRGFLLTMLVVVVALMGLALNEFGTLGEIAGADILGGVVASIMLVVMFLAFGGDPERILRRNRAGLQQFEYVGRFSSEVTDESERVLFLKALETLRGGIGFNFAQIFLADHDGRLVRRVRRGYQDVEILEVEMPDSSAPGVAARTQDVVEVSSMDMANLRDHMMPFSAYGLLVPMAVEGRTLGVMDVQSNEARFSDVEQMAAVAFASQLAALLRDVRTIHQLRDELSSQERAVEGLRNQLQEYRSAARVQVSGAWDTYLEQRGKQAVGFDLGTDGMLIEKDDLPLSLQDALRRGEVVTHIEGDVRRVIVPIKLRGETLGAMSFHVPAGHALGQRRIEMAQNVARRLSVALENQRLLEQSQLQAMRERTASEIGSVLLSATDIDQVLDIAANSFNEALGAIQTHIHLQPEAVESRQERARRTATRKLEITSGEGGES